MWKRCTSWTYKTHQHTISLDSRRDWSQTHPNEIHRNTETTSWHSYQITCTSIIHHSSWIDLPYTINSNNNIRKHQIIACATDPCHCSVTLFLDLNKLLIEKTCTCAYTRKDGRSRNTRREGRKKDQVHGHERILSQTSLPSSSSSSSSISRSHITITSRSRSHNTSWSRSRSGSWIITKN